MQHTPTNPHRLSFKNAVANIYLETTKEQLTVQRCKKRFDYQGKGVFKLCRRDPKKSKAKGRNVCISMGFFFQPATVWGYGKGF